MSAKEGMILFEKEADHRVRALKLWHRPVRSVLTILYLSVDHHFRGGRFGQSGPRNAARGAKIAGNISYLVDLLCTCPLDIGAHVDDALSAITADVKDDIFQAVSYATLCEIMPSVRRGYFNVETVPDGFRLVHPSAEIRRSEERDIAMAELSLAFETRSPPYSAETFDSLLRAWPHLPGDALFVAFTRSRDHYRAALSEAPLLPEAAYPAAFGFSRDEFLGFRVGLMSLADFCLQMADAAERRSRQSFIPWRRRKFERECREWLAPLLNSNFVLGTAAGLGNVDVRSLEKIAPFFTMDAKHFSQAGEGFLPPLFQIDNALLFSPHALRAMLPERNLLYALNKLDGDRFDRLVSEHLEPALLDEAAAILGAVPGFQVARNVIWDAGEIDLLVVQPEARVALQIQAKAALPPQGARMTRQIESHTLKAIDQIKAFEAKPAEFRDALCARAIGSEVIPMKWHGAVLSRSCLGTEKAWSRLGPIAALNPVLLRGAIHRLIGTPGATLAELRKTAQTVLDEVVATTMPSWGTERISVFGKTIEIPSLEIDEKRMAELRHRMIASC
jgi:hypothetical protein